MSSSDGVSDQPKPRSGPRATYPAEQSPASRRRWFIIGSIAVVIAGIGIAILGFRNFGDADVSGEAVGHDVVSADTTVVRYTVNRKDPGQPVACVVRARAQDGAEVGRREVLIPAGDLQQTSMRSDVRTSRRAVIGEVFGCTTSVPPYLKTEE